MAFLGYHTGLSPDEFARLPQKLSQGYARHVEKVWLADVKLRSQTGA